MYKILVQLVGEQTLPNIFPILSLKPDMVVNIYTEKTEKRHRKIANWCSKYAKKHGACPKFSKYPPVQEDIKGIQTGIFRILQSEMERMSDRPDAMLILNMTGGTKSMSASAISLCQQVSNIRVKKGLSPVPICYLNVVTGELEFVTCEEKEAEIVEQPAREVKLSVEEIIETGGDIVMVSARKDWAEVYPVAKKLRALADKGVRFAFDDIKEENYAKKTREPLSKMLSDKDSGRLKRAVAEMRKLAAEVEKNETLRRGVELCGIVARSGDFYFGQELQSEVEETVKRLAANNNLPKNERRQQMRRICMKLNNCANFFVGGWWEVLVAHAYQKANPAAEVLWSVETAPKTDIEHIVETDIIASDGRSLCGISCKRGMHLNKVTQELEQHCTRTALLGGVAHKRVIAVYDSQRFRQLGALLKALRLELWDANTIDCMSRGKPARDAAVAPKPEKEPEGGANATSESEAEAESEAESPSFFRRLAIAARYLFGGKGENPA